MNGIYIISGSNLEPRLAHLLQATMLLEQRGISIDRRSDIYESAPWGKSDQPDFLNQVIQVSCREQPEELMQILLQIEAQMGRERTEKYAPRLIDLDLLYYHDQVVHTTHLNLPHPEIPNRRFVLVPMVQMAPEQKHPILQLSQRTLLNQCPDQLEVKLWKAE